MNKRNYLHFLLDINTNLSLDYSETSGNVNFINILPTKYALSTLVEKEIITDLVTPAWDQYFALAHKDSQTLSKGLANRIIDLYVPVKERVKNLIEALEFLVPSEKNDSVQIKIPSITSLSDLSSVLEDLKKSIELPITHKDIKGSAQISSVDNGSIWIELALGTTTAVTLIGSIAWAAAVINKKRQEGKMLKEQVNAMTLSNDQKKIFLDAQESQVKALLRAEAEHIASSMHSEIEPEEVERLKVSISTTAKLIDAGLEIHPSLTSSESVNNLFPDFSKLPLIESRIKKLGTRSEKEKGDQ